MTDTTLISFIDTSLRSGASRDEIASVLRDAGWADEQIDKGLAAFADVPFPIPVPRPRNKPSARDAFLYLLTFAMLCLSFWNLWTLLSLFVDRLFPEDVGSYERADERIRWATAVLIVAFPVFLLASRTTLREIALDPSRRHSPVRRWFTYLSLFIAAVIIVGDLIALLFSLLSGELTARFVIKSALLGTMAAGIFGYYLWSVRGDEEGEG